MVEVIWKAVTRLLNQHLNEAIKFRDVLNRFWASCGTGTANIEAKLLHQLTAMREAFLSKLLLVLQNAYYALDWDKCLKILVACGFGPRALWILRTYWCQLTMVARADRYFGLPFRGYGGVTQGYPLSPHNL